MGIKSINILNSDYLQWIRQLGTRYRQSQIKAASKVNEELLRFYWQLGKDIVVMRAESKWGTSFYKNLCADLKKALPEAKGFSETNLRYSKTFYEMYSTLLISPQIEGNLECIEIDNVTRQNKGEKDNNPVHSPVADSVGDVETSRIHPQVEDNLERILFSIPWGHHKVLIDKFKCQPEKAFFYINKTIENGWSRSMLLNFLDTDLYERQGKALTNFSKNLPSETSELAQELTKDPYSFEFLSIRQDYNERQLKDALLKNITRFLMELGTGFAYVGKEYRLLIGQKEKFIDLLFYNLKLRCYVVVEVKIDEFDSADIGQLGTYVTAANHLLRQEGVDNPTIGLLVCKNKDNLLAQYALESSSQPIGISEYELSKLYPTEIEGAIPSIEEIELKLKG